ncbi:hypothetical protein NZ698_08090 [Chryseobacterium sp. PBS4-4]|uniref:Phosphatidate cytidylyltransferase n=1 Tax=Chryseobacterium edaphi TaxID=2976532 RepID=A0ABT2W4L5_9FLAO|nr:hypothetical protein [Chryseobacterium edaphi]MCU7617155.1 hypothetical protein [Chryseobacterium edaphi]
MIKLERKYLFIMILITVALLIMGVIFDANTIVMSALIGLTVGALVQLFIHNKSRK